jgi:glycosyltransferase involved in cell wall biosynthesis
MKILIVTPLFPPEIGGPATYSACLLKELPKLGIETIILPFSQVGHYPKFIKQFVFILKIIKLGKSVDLIYAQDPVSVGFLAALASKFLRKPLLLKVVGDYAWEQGVQRTSLNLLLDEYLETEKLPWLVRVLKKVEIYVASTAVEIVVPSQYLKTVVSKWGIDPNKITVVYNAFEGVESVEEKEMSKARLRLNNPFIISAGRLVPWKGFSVLIEAMKELKSSFPNLRLFIAGDGPDRHLLEKEVVVLGLVDQVRFLGKLSRFELFAYLKNAEAFVLNTGYEGLSHQLLEVMFLGTPLVTTRVGGNPEVVTKEDEGILVPYNDKSALVEAIERVLIDKSLQQKLGAAGQARVAFFTEERMIDGIVAVIKKYENSQL